MYCVIIHCRQGGYLVKLKRNVPHIWAGTRDIAINLIAHNWRTDDDAYLIRARSLRKPKKVHTAEVNGFPVVIM